jgi:cytochrome c5
MVRFITVRRCAFVLGAALAAACAATQYGASDANLARARSGSPKGSASFEQQCAGCHGARGESATGAPRILGEGALPEYPRAKNLNADPSAGDPQALKLQAQSRPAGAPWRDPFRTARDLYNYVSKNMPPSEAQRASLSAEDYWAIVSFMLLAHGVAVPPEGVTESNASSVKL